MWLRTKSTQIVSVVVVIDVQYYNLLQKEQLKKENKSRNDSTCTLKIDTNIAFWGSSNRNHEKIRKFDWTIEKPTFYWFGKHP